MGGLLSRLRGADRLVALAALALLLFMFVFSWFGENIAGTLPGSEVSGAGVDATGWESFTNSRWVWLLTALLALACVGARAAQWSPPPWIQPGAVVALLGGVSALLIAYRIVHHPTASAGFGGFHASFGIRIGIWLGFVAALAIAAGGYLQLREEAGPKTESQLEEPGPAFSGLTVAEAAVAPPAPGEDDAGDETAGDAPQAAP